MPSLVFVDSEISPESKKVCDLGAIKEDNEKFHSANIKAFEDFVSGADFVCGHNLIHHDLKYIGDCFATKSNVSFIDTLYLSPLLFPHKPYHRLVKDDILQPDELNNPLNDSIKARDLFYDELNAFYALSSKMKWILCALLYNFPEFQGFFKYIGYKPYTLTPFAIEDEFRGKICANANIDVLIKNYPVELAYALSLIACDDKNSITPRWVLKNYPKVENVIRFLKHNPCKEGCAYCNEKLNVRKQLKRIFGFDNFRTYNNEPLQERAAEAAVKGKSLLAIFPTGGGKSVTFQLPALMAGEAEHGLTIVISPLQSLMKDQVDNLENKGIADAVTINGLLSPIERQDALNRVINGTASMLYISPEQLRSKTIESLLLSRNVSRVVIDEAHCFSAWGQDFRVDYLYIGDFIKELQNKKGLKTPIPVSCFTATAKQKVIADICDYFSRKLDLHLEIFATDSTRENLHYYVLYKETEEEKYNALRNLIDAKKCQTIVYVSKTKKTSELAEKLSSDGFPARPFHGQMEPGEKIENQEAFIKNEVQVIVATSAFGMGVDKQDVKLVVHYDISNSLENYVQEAGRAGRNQSLKADCYVLFNDNDLDQHFMLLNQTKLSISEIQQVWKAIKDLTKTHRTVTCSPLEIARQAGWDDSVYGIETRVKTAISALETAGYVKRGHNVPKLYANSILAKNMQEASAVLERSDLFDEQQKITAKRIIKYLISSRSISGAQDDEAESRVDYIADRLGLEKEVVISSINQMREIHLLADMQDMSAYIHRADSQNKSKQIVDKFIKLENFILSQLNEEGGSFNLKELNDLALKDGISSSTVKNIRTIIYFWTIKSYIQKSEYNSKVRTDIIPALSIERMVAKTTKRLDISKFIVDELYIKSYSKITKTDEDILVEFSLVGLLQAYNETPHLNLYSEPVVLDDIADSLLYLSKIGALSLQGGFLVSYNGMEIKRLMENKIRYKNEDYRLMNEFYKQKIQQIHIVGEYANLMAKDYGAALQFVNDYFQMDYKKFISKYFKGERVAEIERNITPKKYNQLFGCLSDKQAEIINDAESKYIVVAAGPGSGKTRVLVHKLASLLQLEDVKHEQLLMITFSRAAATEFKKRLIDLIGNAAHYVEIKTFHSYCFDLLGKIGNIEEAENVVKNAADMIISGDVEFEKITKSVVVVDEAQDMDENEFALLKALMMCNDDMRLIAVGDDDQNIYEFRGSDSKYLRELVNRYGARKYEMTENYRSKKLIVALANAFAQTISERMKSLPIVSMQNDDGIVQLIHHSSPNMEEAIVEQIIARQDKQSICILTNTNEEALRLLGVCTKHKCAAKLIQSIDGFSLYNLVELRFFVDEIDKNLSTPIISDEVWNKSKDKLKFKYSDSACLDNCLRLLKTFEDINKTKYCTDLVEFIQESNYEDFYKQDKNCIFISTIHKAKGREFDCVYMMMSSLPLNSDENRRKLYVGMTRAKNELFVHYTNDLFNGVKLSEGIQKIEDKNDYGEPQEVGIQLTHKDVFLDYFKEKGDVIANLRSGDNLQMENEYLSAVVGGKLTKVVRFSKICIEKINNLKQNGYEYSNAFIRFIVLWKGKTDGKEASIILPEIHFVKTGQANL
jgi:ATP-dependent DNA helicase RecQ